MSRTDDTIINELVTGADEVSDVGDLPLIDNEISAWLSEMGVEDEIAKLERLVNPRRKGRGA
jgi:hypothetical protein